MFIAKLPPPGSVIPVGAVKTFTEWKVRYVNEGSEGYSLNPGAPLENLNARRAGGWKGPRGERARERASDRDRAKGTGLDGLFLRRADAAIISPVFQGKRGFPSAIVARYRFILQSWLRSSSRSRKSRFHRLPLSSNRSSFDQTTKSEDGTRYSLAVSLVHSLARKNPSGLNRARRIMLDPLAIVLFRPIGKAHRQPEDGRVAESPIQSMPTKRLRDRTC